MGSTAVVSIAKRATKQKVGHLGTLDPMAAGVLPVAVGKATKLFDYFLNKDKKYFAIATFGVLTDTLDSDGKVVKTDNKIIQKTQIEAVLCEFLGNISQIPPEYSSVHVNGERAYNLARNGKQVQIEPRQITIYRLNLQREIAPNMFAFNLHCSAGTYVRALIRDIAVRLGTVATTTCIIRTASGKFNAENSCTLQDVKSGTARLVDVAEVVDLPKLQLEQSDVSKLLNGQPSELNLSNGEYLAYTQQNKLVGIVQCMGGKLKIKVNLWENTND